MDFRTKHHTELPSVGNMLLEHEIIPMFADGSLDYVNRTAIEDIRDDFFEELSESDNDAFKEHLGIVAFDTNEENCDSLGFSELFYFFEPLLEEVWKTEQRGGKEYPVHMEPVRLFKEIIYPQVYYDIDPVEITLNGAVYIATYKSKRMLKICAKLCQNALTEWLKHPSNISEVLYDYEDEDTGECVIEVQFKGIEEDENGLVVAHVMPNGNVFWKQPGYKFNPSVLEAISEVKKELAEEKNK